MKAYENRLIFAAALLLSTPRVLHAQQGMSPPGDCTAEEHRRLKAEVGRACKSTSMKCAPEQDCVTLWKNLVQFQQCIAARRLVADRCFCGGDDSHLGELEGYQRGADACREYIALKRCPNLCQ